MITRVYVCLRYYTAAQFCSFLCFIRACEDPQTGRSLPLWVETVSWERRSSLLLWEAQGSTARAAFSSSILYSARDLGQVTWRLWPSPLLTRPAGMLCTCKCVHRNLPGTSHWALCKGAFLLSLPLGWDFRSCGSTSLFPNILFFSIPWSWRREITQFDCRSVTSKSVIWNVWKIFHSSFLIGCLIPWA